MDTSESQTFVLIHGTFAAGAPWTNPASAFSQRLEKEDGGQVITFRWSGSNSHASRQLAGNQLNDFIRTRRESHPTERYNLICHSHGGNVALYAARQLAFRDAVESIVFLGTPFIQGSARKVAIGISPIITAFVSLAFLIPMFFLIGGNRPGLVYAITVPVALVLWLIVRIRVRDRFASLAIAAAENMQKAAASDLFVNVSGIRSLVVYVSLDEAGTWLRVLNTVSNIPYIAWWFLARSAPWFLYAVVFLAMNLIAIDDADTERHFLQNGFLDSVEQAVAYAIYAPMVALSVFVLLPILTAATSMIIRGNGIAFGYEGVFGHSLLNISASAIPDMQDNTQVTLARVAPSIGGLRHSSFYSDPEVSRLINQFISNEGVVARPPDGLAQQTKFAEYSIDIAAAAVGICLAFVVTSQQLSTKEIIGHLAAFLLLAGLTALVRWALDRLLSKAVDVYR